MTPQAAYQFLKPSLDQFSDKEREELRSLIIGDKKTVRKKTSPVDPVMSCEQMKRKLIRFHFKSRN